MTLSLRLTYAAVMLLAVFIVAGGSFPSIGRRFVVPDTAAPPGYAVGDLYCMSGLDRFRELIPVGRHAPLAPLESAEVLTLGDSFLNSTLESDLFANGLSAKTGLKVHNLQSQSFAAVASFPLPFLESIGYRPGRKRILILESVERAVVKRGITYRRAVSPAGSKQADSLAAINVEYFFKNNVILHPLVSLLRTVKFKLFKIVDKSIGAYAYNPDMLFFQEDIEFANMEKSEEMLDATAASIARLADTLKRRYDIELIYLVIPNKYSIYHGLAREGSRYDGFIPRLTERLADFGVRSVDLYTPFSARSKPGMPLLYYGSDTHYTALGKALAVDACAEAIGKLRGLAPRNAAPVPLKGAMMLRKMHP